MLSARCVINATDHVWTSCQHVKLPATAACLAFCTGKAYRELRQITCGLSPCLSTIRSVRPSPMSTVVISMTGWSPLL